MSSVIGGWIADSLLGKYATICMSFSIYIIGYAAFPILAYHESTLPGFCNANSSVVDWTPILNYTLRYSDSNDHFVDRSLTSEACSWVIILTVIFIGIAVGFLRANLGISHFTLSTAWWCRYLLIFVQIKKGPFGADQCISRGQSMIFKYFNWLYWSINLGSLISFVLLAYIQQNFNFFIGFIIPLCALMVSFLLFVSGSFCYIKKETEVSIISNIFKILYEAFKLRKRQKSFLKQKQRERA